MKYIQKFNESNHNDSISDIIRDIERSKDWEVGNSDVYNFDSHYIYKKSPPDCLFLKSDYQLCHYVIILR